MKTYCPSFTILALPFAAANTACLAQFANNASPQFSMKNFDAVLEKIAAVSEQLNTELAKALTRFQKREANLKHNLCRIESLSLTNMSSSATG